MIHPDDDPIVQLRALIERRANITAGCFDTVETMADMIVLHGCPLEELKEGIKEVIDHARNLMGFQRGIIPHPEQFAKDQL